MLILWRNKRYLTPLEIANLLGGVRTSLVRRGLWFFKKLNMLDIIDSPLKVKLKNSILNEVTNIVKDEILAFNGKHMVVRVGKNYYLITLRRKKIIVRVVEINVLNAVLKVLKEGVGEKYTVSDLANATLLPISKVTIAVKVLTLLDRIVKVGGKFKFSRAT